jgi:ABC-type branched-subunit amino acid transport system ATPase component
LELRTESVSRHFGGVTALHDVSVHLRPGRVLGLVGPNGAGKTTLVNAITGIVPPSSGRVLIDGQNVTNMPAWQLSRRGVARTFQNLRVFTHLSALDNVLAGTVRRLPRTYFSRLLFLPHARKQEHEQAARAVTLLDLVGLAGKEAIRGDQLSYGDQRRLEIARALASNPGLVILDEPAAGMNANEAARLVGLIRRIAETGRSVVLIEHNMSVVMKASDDVAVLNFGEVIGQGTPDQIKTAPAVVEAYLGA